MQERRRIILQRLEEYGSVKVNELSSEFGCSEVTIRSDKDLKEMKGWLFFLFLKLPNNCYNCQPIA